MRLILAVVAAGSAHALLIPGRRVRVPRPSPAALLAAVCGGIVAASAGASVVVIAVAVGGCSLVPTVRRRVAAARSAAAVRQEWPDFLAIVRSRIGTGEPLPDAVRAAARTIGGAFQDLDRAWGGSFLDELESARERWADPVADRVLTTIRVAASTGGAHVDAVLSALSVSLSDEMRIRAAHDAALTQQRMTARVALVSPWAILLLSVATNPQAAAEFSTPAGRSILLAGAVATGAGHLLARRAARLTSAPRVFG